MDEDVDTTSAARLVDQLPSTINLRAPDLFAKLNRRKQPA
jgi:hypothetical protein